ncbi:7-carboxy-7-deazaguanine synthase [Kistimonas asteriae]|uniref:7-carboxy-7-deazaguanine synthase n=1 Tax=Kistimonas asteriae TaxID=517724 RepID=UPI001BAA6561|nr:7-carboxy-7-deazaguanine synthase [Kistimonas asteriae]
MYSVKEIFYTLQGEGAHTGRPAIFCRFSGCNLWSGLEKHRTNAICNFCDTDFRGTDGPGGGRFDTAEQLADTLLKYWPTGQTARPFVVCTGGEPLLQLDQPLADAMHERDIEIALETNGTLAPPRGIDWVCVSPKGKADVVITECDELKLVYPQQDAMPERFAHIRAQYYYLTPVADPHTGSDARLYRDTVTAETIAYCLAHPQWRLNLQSHKVINIA